MVDSVNQETVESLRERVSDLEECLAEVTDRHSRTRLSRRSALAGLLGAGAIAGGTGTAAAAQQWDDTDSDGLLEAPNHEGVDVSTVASQDVTAGSARVADADRTINVSLENFSGGDIGAAFNNARAQHGQSGVLYDVAPGVYDLTTTLDLTNFNPPSSEEYTVDLDLRGVFLRQQTNVALDLTGANRITVWGGEIDEENGNTSDVGILLARSDQHEPAASHRFVNTHVSGKYKVAPLYILNSEVNVFNGCIIHNKSGHNFGPSGSAGVIVATSNFKNVTSPHATIETKVTCNSQQFFGGEIEGWRGLWLHSGTTSQGVDRPVQEVHCRGVEFGAINDAVTLDVSENVGIEHVTLDTCRTSDDIPARIVDIVPGTSRQTIDGLSIDGGYHAAGTKEIYLGQPGESLLRHAYISPNTRWHAANGIKLSDAAFVHFDLADNQAVDVLGEIRNSTVRLDGLAKFDAATATRVHLQGKQTGQIELRHQGERLQLDRRWFGTSFTQNLSNKVPRFDGQVMRDDGTNFATGAYARADTTNGEWVALSDSTQTVSY